MKTILKLKTILKRKLFKNVNPTEMNMSVTSSLYLYIAYGHGIVWSSFLKHISVTRYSSSILSSAKELFSVKNGGKTNNCPRFNF